MTQQYIAEKNEVLQSIREASDGLANPVDRLFTEFCLAWPEGVRAAWVDPLGPMRPVFGRILPAGMSVLAHKDDFRERAFGKLMPNGLMGQFGLNVYLRCPPIGGELLLFLLEIPSEKLRELRGNDYGIPLAVLGQPTLALKPEEGELILFDSLKFHGIASGDRERITLSAFVGIPRSTGPLLIWS